MSADVFGTTVEERAHALVMRLPILPTMLPPEDPARIVAELLESQSLADEWEDFGECPGCDSLQESIDELQSDNSELQVFAQGVCEALGVDSTMDLEDVLEALKERLTRTGERA